jgi:anhydro-N-acetylmuramic acid kinase
MSTLFIGLMSGTSMDGIDGVLAEFATNAPRTLAWIHAPMPADLRNQLMELMANQNVSIREYAAADVALGRVFAGVALELIRASDVRAGQIKAIGSHGQTLFHDPNGKFPTSIQLGDPNIIAEACGLTTVADFRRRDVAAGGQGAPLVPAFHACVFRDSSEQRAILNIGGMANVTVLSPEPAEPVIGFDTGPGNVLMDMWIQEAMGAPYDMDGRWAASGSCLANLLESMLADSYFGRKPPKSTGRELFHRQWLQTHLDACGIDALNPQRAADIQATLCELTSLSVADALRRWARGTVRLIVCGGGSRNAHLVRRLAQHTGIAVQSSNELGIDALQVEALAFAWLAKQTLEAKPGNVPSVTGARHAAILGAIYPGSPSLAR